MHSKEYLGRLPSYIAKFPIGSYILEREIGRLHLYEAMLGVPVVSGGDRHGCEANAVLNLSRAQSFEEFVDELSKQKQSEILLMPQFFEPLQLRLIENAWHALADAPGEFARRHWMSRVFLEEDGQAMALSQFLGTRFHRLIDKFRWVLGLVANPVLRPALKLPFLGNQEGGL
jgi:hypothetical protein